MNYTQNCNIISRISPYVDEITGDHLCGVWHVKPTNDESITSKNQLNALI